MSDIGSLSGVDSVLKSALDGLTLRQKSIANNVANVDTPGYKATEVTFERQLKLAFDRQQPDQLATSDSRHMDVTGGTTFAAQVQTDAATALRNDGNNVDIDREMIALADTSIKFDAVSQVMSQRLGLLRSIIGAGQR